MLLLITQREETNKYGAKIDVLENAYIEYFLNEGFDSIVSVPNSLDAIEGLLELSPDVIILSGGGDVGKQPTRDKIEKALLDYAISYDVRVLGICRGMQFINTYFGGNVIQKSIFSGRNKHEIILTNQNFVSQVGRNRGPVNSYHNFTVTDKTLANELEVFAISDLSVIEGIYHKKHEIFGIQWHPERNNNMSSWIDTTLCSWLRGDEDLVLQ